MALAVGAKKITKPSLVVFSPLPPMENGIADYCAELLPELTREYDLILVINDHVPAPPFGSQYQILRLAQYLAREAIFKSHPHLYHVGNNPDHGYLVPILLRNPGILVLHDISLHYLIDQMTCGWGDFESYSELLEREFGGPGWLLAEQFKKFNIREQIMFYELPMIRFIASRCRAVVVHSWYGKTKLLAQEQEVPVEVIRHHLAESAVVAEESISKAAAREFLGIEVDELLLVSLGFITRAKQIDTVLETLAGCRHKLTKIRYILAGQDQPDHYDVKASIRAFGLEEVVEVTGYLDEESFYIYTKAADIVINLRYPTGGETSGTLIRALGMGACVIVVDIGPFAEYPNDICVKVPWSDEFSSAFMKVFLMLASKPDTRSKFGIAAKKYIQKNHSLRGSGLEYHRIIQQYSSHMAAPWRFEQTYEYPTVSGRASVLKKYITDFNYPIPLWLREMQFPIAPQNMRSNTLVIGDAMEMNIICSCLGYDPEAVTLISPEAASTAIKTLGRRSISRAMVNLNASSNAIELHSLLAQLNYILEIDAFLLLSGSDGWQLSGGLSQSLMPLILRNSGYRMTSYVSSPHDYSPVLDEPETRRDRNTSGCQNPCWSAQKISEFIRPSTSTLSSEIDSGSTE